MARKLSGEASAEELQELEQLLWQHPEGNYSMEVMQDLWKSKPAADRQYAENEYRKLAQKLIQSGDGEFEDQEAHYVTEDVHGEAVHEEITYEEPARKRKWMPWAFALGAVIIAASAFLYQQNGSDNKTAAEMPARNEISTRYGSKTSLVLPDGSKVWLNAGSKLSYDKNYGNSLREVTLAGEAFFDVVKNPSRPFIIHTSKMEVRVLGTAFNVKCYPDEKKTETSLIRGSVEITLKNRPEKIVLKPNEKIVINDDEPGDEQPVQTTAAKSGGGPVKAAEPIFTLEHVTREPVNNEIIETSWIDNRLIFNNETFEEIAVKMERWYAVHISVENEKLKKKRFTGTFENETISQALSAMQLTLPFGYSISKDQIIIK
jgi:ferric-dicitrate binding protein FerR (iron transport regulator)